MFVIEAKTAEQFRAEVVKHYQEEYDKANREFERLTNNRIKNPRKVRDRDVSYAWIKRCLFLNQLNFWKDVAVTESMDKLFKRSAKIDPETSALSKAGRAAIRAIETTKE